MKSKFNYQVFLSRVARNQYKLHNLKQEWKVFILFIFLAKVLTWSISIFAGFNYLRQMILKVGLNMEESTYLTIFALIILEGATTIALAKFFKFAYRGTNHLSTSIALAFVVLGLFGLSFTISTNGLAMRQSNKVDNTEIIIENNDFKIEQIKAEYKEIIADLDTQITIIVNNPQGWSGGVRAKLLQHQQDTISALSNRKLDFRQKEKNELVLLDDKKGSELLVNNQETTAEADKYYKIVIVVMIIQFISSGVLMFFFKRILNEDDEKLLISEDIKELKDTMFTNAFFAVKNQMTEVANMIATQLVVANEQYEPTIQIDNNTEKKTDETKERVKVLGFGNRLKDQSKKPVVKTSQKPVAKTNEQSKRFDSRKYLHPKEIQQKHIEFLNKHKIIVKSIKLINLAEKETITNDEVRQVQSVAKRAKHKGRTLVRDVYRVAVTVGLNKIDSNGNLIF